MSASGPIVIVEDDDDDQTIVKEAIQEIGIPNTLLFFSNAIDAFAFLVETTVQPFFILCDINLPKQNGVEFKKNIDRNEYLSQKSIPFLFFSTAVDKHIINFAYKELTIQGFFQKPARFEEIKYSLQIIISYWKLCKHPNN